MPYPPKIDFGGLGGELIEYARLMHEYGAKGLDAPLREAEAALKAAIEKVKALPVDAEMKAREPDGLDAIRALRAPGPRRIWKALPADFEDRLAGAFLARFAGCTLGAIVEGNSVESMEEWAKYLHFQFPPTDYWPQARNPASVRYLKGLCESYTSAKMDGAPVDDDTTYTLIGLVIAEEYGLGFTTADVGDAWVKYLPMACTAEDVALRNLKNGVPAEKAADIGNPFCQWIGADIRCDPWAYMSPGWPERAAELAYRDAYLSHRRNGIYGAMFFAAAIAAAFTVDNAVDALKLGLTEIPQGCALRADIEWALAESANVHDYKAARAAVDERFAGMHSVHTNNNAALTVFGLTIGAGDVSKTIGETVAMGLDNDCTAATAGSIAGAIAGKKGVRTRWYEPFHNKAYSYMNVHGEFAIDDALRRFAALARANLSQA